MGFTVIRSVAKKVIARRLLKFHPDKSCTVVCLAFLPTQESRKLLLITPAAARPRISLVA